jgi:hypothetical protein
LIPTARRRVSSRTVSAKRGDELSSSEKHHDSSGGKQWFMIHETYPMNSGLERLGSGLSGGSVKPAMPMSACAGTSRSTSL